MHPAPEAVLTEQLHIPIVDVLMMARRHMGHASNDGEGVESWHRFCAELESKLPAGSGVVYDRQLSPAANARFLAEAQGITTAADPQGERP